MASFPAVAPNPLALHSFAATLTSKLFSKSLKSTTFFCRAERQEYSFIWCDFTSAEVTLNILWVQLQLATVRREVIKS